MLNPMTLFMIDNVFLSMLHSYHDVVFLIFDVFSPTTVPL